MHLVGQWTFNEGAGEGVIDSSGNRNHGSYEKYAGGVELRRVQSRRGVLKPAVAQHAPNKVPPSAAPQLAPVSLLRAPRQRRSSPP